MKTKSQINKPRINKDEETQINEDFMEEYKKIITELFQTKYDDEDLAEQIAYLLEEECNDNEWPYQGFKRDIIDYSDDTSMIAETIRNGLDEYGQDDIPSSDEIRKILKKGIVRYEDKEFYPLRIKLQYTKKQEEEARKLFHSLCPTIFTSESDQKDSGLAILKAIDNINGNHGLLLLLRDTYTRYIIDHNKPKLGILRFWEKYYSYPKQLEHIQAKHRINTLGIGLQSFNQRILSTYISADNFGYTICDQLGTFIDYAIGCSSFINWILGRYSDDGYDVKEQEKSEATLPLLFDFWIIPQCTQRNVPEHNDKDDPDDDVDDIKQASNDDAKYCYLGYGGIDASNNAPIHSIGDVKQCLIDNGYEQDKDFAMKRIPTNEMSIKRAEKFFMKTYMKLNSKKKIYERFIFIIDRRNPKHYLHPAASEKDTTDGDNDEGEDKGKRFDLGENGDDKEWDDIIYCIRPKQDEERILDKNYVQFPEVFLELSRRFMLPINLGESIGITMPINGYMFNLSYHLYSDDIQRCYWTQNGKTQRFFKQDINKLWTKQFVKIQDKYQTIDGYHKDMLKTQFKELTDEKFHKFYRDTTTSSH